MKRGLDLVLLLLLAMTAAPFFSYVSATANLLAQFLLQVAVATAIYLLIVAVRRDRPPCIAALVLLCVQLVLLQPPWPLSGSAAADRATATSVLYSNLWSDNPRLEEAVALIRAKHPDVVVLAEATPHHVGELTALETIYPWRVDCTGVPGCDVIIFSKYEVLDELKFADAEHKRSMALARVATPSGPVDIAGTHLTRPFPTWRLKRQIAHVKNLAPVLAGREGPVLLAGDFNTATWGRVIQVLERASNLKAAGGLEGTWPSWLPWPLRIPIDHVLVSPGLKIRDRQVLHIPGSDHKGVLVEIERVAQAG